ncbi:MAG: hypothetical protein EDX89_22860 [Acidobacteria bacterium]|nr:MAG: hypothetical protein EDX89_22860 [Acidobacteriota bacterium]
MSDLGADLPASRPFEREVRVFVVGGLLFLLFLAGLSLVAFRNATEWAVAENARRRQGEAALVALRLAGSGAAERWLAEDGETASLLLSLGARQAALFDVEGRRLAAASYLPDADLLPERLDAADRPAPGRAVVREALDEPTPLVVVVVSAPGGAGHLRVAFDATALSAARRTEAVLSTVVPAAALALVLLALLFLRRLMRPIDALTQTARGAGGLVGGEPAPRGDEADRAVATFARTVEELRRRTAELEDLRRREKERADALAVTAATLVRSHPGGLLVVDATLRLTEANRPALAALDLSRDALGQGARDVLAAWPPLRAAVESAAQGTPTLAAEFASGEATGGRLLALTAVPVADAAGRRLGVLVFLEDRTATKRLERELSARRELAALGEMSAGIAHEFRNATATILGFVRLAASAESPEARARHLSAIRREAEHVARITGDFLLFARPERVERAETDLDALVAEAVRDERVVLPGVTVEVEGAFGTAWGDAALLRRALVNLVRNAAEAASGGGGTRVLVSGERGEDAVRVRVEDDGPGIAEAEAEKVFVPFFSTKEGGTGLGLALVAKIATLHGGTVSVERSPALGGARFVLALPVAAP